MPKFHKQKCLKESSDEGSNDCNYVNVSYDDPGSDASSDSGDLEVVEPEIPSVAYQDDSPYQSPNADDKKYYSEYSLNERSSHSVYEGTSHFYKSFESPRTEEDPSYSIVDSSTIQSSSDYHYGDFKKDSSPSFDEGKRKRKTEETNRNNGPSNADYISKSKKRRSEHHDSNSGNSKRLSSNSHISDQASKSSFSSKHIIAVTLSEESSDPDDHFEESENQDYASGHSLAKLTEDPADFEEHCSNPSFTKSEDKRKNRQSYVETSGLKKRLGSSNIGNLLMKKMGYREGEGLGKHAQGRVEPVELSKQKGRHGLGLSLPGLDGEKIEWDPNIEEISEKEPIDWLENLEMDGLDYETMVDFWINEGPKNLDIESMTDFIDEELLSNILKKKSVFDNLSGDELRQAVTRCNPFESIRKGVFLNRAALKMANMDYAFDFMFTNPKHRNNTPMVKENELLYFADVCAGPGGFSEYIFFRKKWLAKGIGFTLKGDNDFKLQDFLAGPSETFEPFYGDKDDGNIFDPANITSLTKFVMNVTEGKGVHFVMADGGFSVKGQENIQELLSKQLYLCQFLVALSIVQVDGHFVCKLFDLFSVFSAGLVYLMYRAFYKICIFKPNTSRPANSERYIICQHRRSDSEPIRDYLFEINLRLWRQGENSNVDINECVPLEMIKGDKYFFSYLRDSNNRLGNRQVVNLDKIAAYYQDQNLHEPSQNELRARCMKLWKVPTGPRISDLTSDTEATKIIIKSILKEKYRPEVVPEILKLQGKLLNSKNIEDIFNYSILDWQCFPLGSDNKLCFLLGLGKNKVYRWANTRWEHEANLELTPGTLIYGEFIPEYRGFGMKQTKMTAFHIIDGFALGYKPIAHHPYMERLKNLNLYAKALRKWNNSSLHPIRVKTPVALTNINDLYKRIDNYFLKSACQKELCIYYPDFNYYMQIKGMAFIRTTREPWRKHMSKSQHRFYYYNSENRNSVYENERPQEAVASSIDSLKNQVIWMFETGVGFKGEVHKDNVLHKEHLLGFIKKKV